MKPRRRILPFAAALFLLGGCAIEFDQDGALALARYELLDNGQIVIDVHVNGEGPFLFAVDTGASISVIHDRLRDRLALEEDPDRLVTIHGALATRQFPILNVEQLAVGGEVWRPVRIASMPGKTQPLEDIDGILGLDFLRRYGVGFSARERVIRLYPPDLIGTRTYRGWASVPLRPESFGASGATVIMFTVYIGDKRIPALFDLGSGINLINWAAARRLSLRPEELLEDRPFAGAIDTTRDVGWFRINEVSTGGVRWNNETFSVVDLHVFELLGKADEPFALIGSGLFSQRDFIIDFASNRLLVRTAMSELDADGTEQERPSPRQFPVHRSLPWVIEKN